MTSDAAALFTAVDRAVPPDLQVEWGRATRPAARCLVHRRIHRICGRGMGIVVRPAQLLPRQLGATQDAPDELPREQAVAQAVRVAFRDLGNLPGDAAVFVRVNAPFLAGDLPVPPRPGRVVAEVDGLAAGDATVRDGLLRLKALGCRIAVGDFTGTAEQRRLLPFADFVKIDSRDLELEGRPLLRLATSRGAEVVAEFVDSPDQLAQCRAASIALVQGRVFETGSPVPRSVLSSAFRA